jgi:hypothetical protein
MPRASRIPTVQRSVWLLALVLRSPCIDLRVKNRHTSSFRSRDFRWHGDVQGCHGLVKSLRPKIPRIQKPQKYLQFSLLK